MGMIEANPDMPVTAEWLRSNTRIRGWLAFFMFGLLLSALWGLGEVFVTVDTSDCYGSIILSTVDVVTVLALLVVAILTFVAFHRRWPSAVFWARFFFDLYQIVINESSEIINTLYEYIYENKKINLKEVVGNNSYSTGLPIK